MHHRIEEHWILNIGEVLGYYQMARAADREPLGYTLNYAKEKGGENIHAHGYVIMIKTFAHVPTVFYVRSKCRHDYHEDTRF